MVGNRRANTLAAALAALCSLLFSIGSVAAQQANAQGLWVGGYNYFSEFEGPALQQSGTPDADLAFGSQIYFAPTSIAFDEHENLWAVFQGINDNFPAAALEISRRNMALLKRGRRVKPKFIIIPSAGGNLAFDASDDLWIATEIRVAGALQGGMVEFRRGQIKNSGRPKPTISIPTPGFNPSVIRFDASDSLWVAQFQLPYDPSNPLQVWRFAPSDRDAKRPTASLVVNLPDLAFLVDFAFDSSGNLWLAGAAPHGDELEMISATDIAGTGAISPLAAVTIASSAFGSLHGSGSCVGGIDFDNSGDLWVSVDAGNSDCQADTQLVEFTPKQLNIGGNLTPSVTIGQNANKSNLFFPGPIRFGPTVP
jgi:hypothetical protein